MMTTKY